jgi:hypothetical protein
VLNLAPLNALPLNTGGSVRLVTFGAVSVTASATATCELPIAERRFAAAVSGTATHDVTLVRRRGMAGYGTATAIANPPPAMAAVRRLDGEGFAFATGFLSLAVTREFSADVTATATGVLFPFDEVFDAAVSATATVELAEFQRIRTMAATGSAGAAATFDDTVELDRGFWSSVSATAESHGEPDITRGGIRYAEFSARVTAGATAAAPALLVSKRMAANVSASASAAHVGPINRIRRMLAAPVVSQATAALAAMVAQVFPQPLAVTGSATASLPWLGKPQRFAANATATATAAGAKIVRPIAAMRGAPALAVATGTATMSRKHAMAGSAFGFANADPMMPRLAIPFAASVTAIATSEAAANAGDNIARHFSADVQATAEAVSEGHFTIRGFAADATVSALAEGSMLRGRGFAASVTATAEGTAELRTGLYETEPDYRTVLVPVQQFVAVVPPQEFVLYVRDDSRAMDTFTKQPGEKLAYDIDFVEWFAELPSDDIESATAVITSATSGAVTDLTIEQPLLIGQPSQRVKIWVEDGIDGATYQITLTVNTEGGRRKEVDFRVRVKED